MLFASGIAGSASRAVKPLHAQANSSSSGRLSGGRHMRLMQPQQLCATSGGSGDQSVSAEELAAYNEYLKEKKATRQAALQDLKRKRKFNPLHTRMKISAAPPGADQQSSESDAVAVKGSSASSNAAAEVNPAALDLDNQTPAGAEGAAQGQMSPAPDILQQQRQQKRQQQQQKQQLLTPSQASSSAAAAGASSPPSPPSTSQPPSSPHGSSSSSSSMLPQEADEDEDFGAILAELLADGSDIPDVEEVLVPVQRQKSTAQAKAAAANRRQQQQKQQQPGQISAAIAAPRQQSAAEERVSMPTYKGKARLSNTSTSTSSSSGVGAAGNLLQQLTAAMQAEEAAEAAAAADGGGAGHEEDKDDLDWEALGQYEQLESYLHQLQKDKAAPRRALAESAGSKAATGRTPDMRAAAAAAAAAVAGGVLPSAQEALGAVNFKVKKQDPNRTAGPSKTSGSSGGGRLGAGGRSQLDRDLDDMEELVAFLEVMQTSSSSSGGGGGGSRGSSQHQGSAAAPAGAAAAQDPGEAALKALLGEDWEAELLDELAAVIDEDADQPQQQQQMVAAADKQQTDPGHGGATDVSAAAAGPASDGADDGDGDDAPWADDITGLLLGLVTISHEKYLGSPIALPDIEAVGEEGRCQAFYDAPFALFVVDDSMQSSIEYVNAAAERMFGGGYLDLFGQPAHTLVAADLHAQADWAFAGRQVEASAAFSCQLPQLQLQDMSGRAVLGQDVSVWRVDSLESTPIGMAVLVKQWHPAADLIKGKQDV